MDVRELVMRGEDETKLYACGKCGKLYSPTIYACKGAPAHAAARLGAADCCKPPTCSVCGVGVSSPWTKCATHRLQGALARATPIIASEWDEPVYSDEAPGEWGDGFSSSWRDLIESHHDAQAWGDIPSGTLYPAFCWPCVPEPLRLDPVSILERVTDGLHEEASDQIVATDELTDFITAWNAKQTCKAWFPDRSRVVVLNKARFTQLLEAKG